MKNRNSYILGLSVPLLLGLSALADPITPLPITAIQASHLDWQVTGEGVAFAALRGDRFVEPYMAMVRLPAGLVSPPHTKSANMFGVVLSGTMYHVPAGEDQANAVPLSAGSYYQIPAGLAHVSSCVYKEECITFLYQDGNFDFLPVTAPPNTGTPISGEVPK